MSNEDLNEALLNLKLIKIFVCLKNSYNCIYSCQRKESQKVSLSNLVSITNCRIVLLPKKPRRKLNETYIYIDIV